MRCETMVGTKKRRRLISVGLHAINYKRGARSEITFFNRRAKSVNYDFKFEMQYSESIIHICME